MKFLFLFLLSLALPLQVQAQITPSVHTHIWGDFTGFNQTPGHDAEALRAIMENEKQINLDSNGHIKLEKGSVSFSFLDSAGGPSMSGTKEFCMGLTFEAGSFSSSSTLSNLFSGKFNADLEGGATLDMDISFNGKTPVISFIPPPTAAGSGQLTNIDFSKDLTVFISHDENDKLTISFYSGTTLTTSMEFDGVTLSGGDMERFVIGDANSNMVLKGLGVMVGDSMDDTWKKDYFDKVGAQSVPEPGAAILALWGGVFVLCRRRRAA